MVHSNHQQWLLQQTLTNLTGDAVASLWGRWVTFGNEATRPEFLIVAGQRSPLGAATLEAHVAERKAPLLPGCEAREVRFWIGVATKWWTVEGAAEGSDSEEGGTMVA